MRVSAMARWVCVLAAALIVASGCSVTPDYSAPASFAISDDAVVNVVQQALGRTASATRLNGTPMVHCSGESHCTIAYTVHEPFGLVYDTEVLLPTRQIWKAMFTDPRFQAGTITVRAPSETRYVTENLGVLFTLSCDRAAASKINWSEIDASDLKKLCSYTQQDELPFTGLHGPTGVAVDPAGNVFVTDNGNNRVLKLPAVKKGMGSNPTKTTPAGLPFSAHSPSGVATIAGDVFVAASGRVLIQTVWGDAPTELPFTGLNGPMGLAVDSDEDVYLASGGDRRLMKLQAGSTAQVISFRGGPEQLSGAVAVDIARNIYFAGTDSVWVLLAGDDSPIRLPLTDLQSPNGLAVDAECNIFLTDGLDTTHSRVLFLLSGSTTPVELPFTGLNHPTGVAIDTFGNVYVADTGNNRVLSLSSAVISKTVAPIRAGQSARTLTRCS